MKRIAASYLYPLTDVRPLRNGFVELADDGTVLRTGISEDPSREEIFLEGAVAPGLVNAHCHIELSYLKGRFRKGTGMAGFIDQINAMRDTSPREERIACLSREMDNLWSQGVVAMADISNCDESFAVKRAHPMYTRTFLEVFGTEPEDCAGVMEGVYALQQKARALGLDAAPTPHACYTMSPQLLMAASGAGLRSGFLSYHSEETPEEEEMVREGRGAMWENRKAAGMSVPPVTGTSSLQYFLDLLEKVWPAPVREHVLLVHECCLDAAGAAALKTRVPGAYVAVCQSSAAHSADAGGRAPDLCGYGLPFLQRPLEPRGGTLLPSGALPRSASGRTAHLGLPERSRIPGPELSGYPGGGKAPGPGIHRPFGER